MLHRLRRSIICHARGTFIFFVSKTLDALIDVIPVPGYVACPRDESQMRAQRVCMCY